MQVLQPITIYMDNQAAMFMASNLVSNKRSKHIDILFRMIKNCITKGIFALEYISNGMTIADVMTKAIDKFPYRQLNKLLIQEIERTKHASNLLTILSRGKSWYNMVIAACQHVRNISKLMYCEQSEQQNVLSTIEHVDQDH